MRALLRKVGIRQFTATYSIVFMLLVSTARADEAADSAELWNKLSHQLQTRCLI